jgi:hypothetical protein
MSQATLKDDIVEEIKSLSASKAKEVLDFIFFVKHKETLARIDPTQAYFYTRKWRKLELDAEKDLKAGRISEPYTAYEVDRLFADLKKGKRKAGK